ncbi:MAG: type II toxin-antitoxin system HicA family toxin [Segetibacter sp.]|nr:type II toxin-antitoxin system HicA family toxin [Segetibacter sp.]
MKIPRDISGRGIIKALKVFGYETVRQNGSHIMVTSIKNGEHHLVIPNHNPLKVGTLNGIISQVAQHFQLTKEEVLNQLFR